MLAGTDKRIDAVAPLITWNDLSAALFPNAIDTRANSAGTPADATAAPDGVFKKSWAASLMASITSGTALTAGTTGTAPSDSGDSGFGRGTSSASAAPTGAPASAPPTADQQSVAAPGCGRMMPALCAAYSQAAQTGRESPALKALLDKSSPKAVVGDITAPTLLVQGERDTLFGLDQSDANARAIAAKGTTVALTWYNGGHDGGSPDQVTRDRISNWFGYYLAGSGAKPATTFSYSVDGPLSDTGRARTRTLQAPAYPGLAGAAATPVTTVELAGPEQTILNPPGGSPAGISSLPGLSGISALAGTALANLGGGIPGQVARYASSPLTALMVISGTPRIDVTVSSVGLSEAAGSASAADGAVLFASVSKVSSGGTRTLAGSAVAPIRITDLPSDGSAKTIRINLPAVAFQVEAGSRIEVDLSTTDQAYAGPTSPAVYQVALASGALTVPQVGGVRVSAGDVPVATLIALIVLVVIVVIGLILLGRVRSHHARRADPTATDDTAAGSAATAPLPLEIVRLGKSYPGGVAAVADVSFRVETGQVLGLLGPNGAGKTTTLRMVMGLISPTAGEIRVFGQHVHPGAEILARIGSFVEGSGFLPHLSGAMNLDLYWRATGRPAQDAHMAEALEIAGLGKAINRKVKTYSQGMRQRLAIAQAMLGLPDLLLLDEPTNGLDPPQIHAMREVLRAYAASGRTVLVSSHMLSEVEQTCSHVVVVHQGRTIAAGTVTEMVAASGDMVFSVDSECRAIDVLQALPGVGDIAVDDPDGPPGGGPGPGLVRADLGTCSAAQAVSALVTAGVGVTSAAPRNRLEDVFLELVGASGPTTPGDAG
jgi:ABC-2 type transport system ATP-binding protein